jgi:hypothetical protein
MREIPVSQPIYLLWYFTKIAFYNWFVDSINDVSLDNIGAAVFWMNTTFSAEDVKTVNLFMTWE